MTVSWSAEQLDLIGRSAELDIATRRGDGTLRSPVPIWVVRIDGDVYVRTWYRRTTGWFGHVIDVPRAHIHVPGLEADVIVTDRGDGPAEFRATVDAAYQVKYGAGYRSMVSDEAAATTLRLDPE